MSGFEFGTFCPLMRVHGHREPREDVASDNPGGPNEIWSYGEEVAQICARYIHLREALRPYIGLLVAPIVEAGARSARVYLPAGVRWQQLLIAGGEEGEKAGTASYTLGDVFEGGQEVTIDAPLECIPVFVRENTELGSC